MFTGIIETIGVLEKVDQEGSNFHFLVKSEISGQLKLDQSVAHDGVCLTVTKCEPNAHWVTAVAETIKKTNLSKWRKGKIINLERSLKIGDRLDGNIVQGHVDTMAQCTEEKERDGSFLFSFKFPEKYAPLVIEKGSVCINGVSLTTFEVEKNTFWVTIIPYTFEHTSFKKLVVGNEVNIEFDVLGKYLLRRESLEK